jgi:hypothetical protein
MVTSVTLDPECISPDRGNAMVALDLCCGKGGWAAGLIEAGWIVYGVDLADFSKVYPGNFVQANLLTWEGWREIPGIRLVVASSPCEEFSRWDMPWTRKRNPPAPSLALVERCRFIAAELGVPIVTENVRGAQRWLGKSRANCGPFHLWDDVPALIPYFGGRKKESYGSARRPERAVVPRDLARFIGQCFAMQFRKEGELRHDI